VTMSDLTQQKCKPCEGGLAPLSTVLVHGHLADLPGWQLQGNTIVKTFSFKNYYETMAFVNATAFISHQEDHHPDLLVTYKQCQVTYTTHAIHGLSLNDFICAAKVNELVKKR